MQLRAPPRRWFPANATDSEPPKTSPDQPTPRYNGPVPFTIRDFQPADFDTLWRIDQLCFPLGISYSRAELKLYIRRRGSFTRGAEEAAQVATAAPDSG